MQVSLPLTRRLGVAQAVDELDLGLLGQALWRKKRWIVGLTLAAAGIAFIAVNLITPRYKSEARVLIETRENIFLRPEAEKSLERNATVDQEAVTSQVQLILSRDLARDIVKKLKLGERPEFDPILQGVSLVRTVLGLFGIGKDPMSQTPEERVLKSYFDRLSAYQVEKSRVIAIEFESEDPELAAQVANAIAEGYLALQQSAKQVQTRAAGRWLAGEIDNLRTKVAEAEAKVEEYRSKSNLFVGTNNTSLSNQQLGDSNGQLASARSAKADAEAKSRIIRDTLRSGAPVEFSDIINSELMRRLSEQRVTLRAQLAEQSSTLLDQHPRIKELRAQIADLERLMRAEADRLSRSLENDAKLAGARVEALSASLDQLKRQASSNNEQDVQLRALERDAKSQRDLLESYLAKYREATARDSIGAASPDARIISTATVSNLPSWPKKLPTVLVAALGTFALSVGFILSGELLSGAPAEPVAAGEVAIPVAELRPSISRYAAISRPRAPIVNPPAAPNEPIEPVSVAGNEPIEPANVESEPVQQQAAPPPPNEVRTAADAALDPIEGLASELAGAGEAGRRITVLGARRNMSTTLTTITLARALAKQARVVVIDLALDAPGLSVIAADASGPGISELILGSASFGQIITRDRFSRVHVITAGRATGDTSAIFNAQRLSITLEALARSYDYVVIDGGALRNAPTERIALFAPRAVLVADELDDPATVSAHDALLAAGFANVSVLVNPPEGPQSDANGTRAAA
jgi:uncharacterized protein involved in exopolysaccharide biosynthesis/Mrp family chromosome partitioning ATPase